MCFNASNAGGPCTSRRTARRAVVFVALATLVGCGGDMHAPERTGAVTTTVQADQIRHDCEPLTKRFPAIGHPISARWMGGSLGGGSHSRVSDFVPGPTDYWIDAVIELESDTADE